MDNKKNNIDVKYVANLASINLSVDEINLFQSQLDQILSYINQLNEVDISDVDDNRINAVSLNDLRNDIISESIHHDYVKKNAPVYNNNHIQVPKILD